MTVLVVTRAWDTTADLVIRALDRFPVTVTRINTEDFPTRAAINFAAGDSGISALLDTGYGRTVSTTSVSSVYFRRPDPPRIDDTVTDPAWRTFAENESRSALSGFLRLIDHARWVNHPALIAEAEHKLLQLTHARRAGLRIPKTTVTNNPQVARAFTTMLRTTVVAKTLRSPLVTLTPAQFVYTRRLSKSDLEQLDAIALSPCILQEWIPKKFEVRVVVVGDSAYAVGINSGDLDDWRTRDARQLPHFRHELPNDISTKCVNLVHGFGLLYGALDLIVTPSEEYVFLELNPNGEWGWLTETLGDTIQAALARQLAAIVHVN